MANSVALASKPAPQASPDTVVASAIAMRARLRELEPQTNLDRKVPAETIRAFKDAGFFRLVQPARYGGFDADYELCTRVVEELTQGCSSSAWVYGVLSLHNLFLSAWPQAVQDEVWGQDPEVLISSSLAPRPVVRVEGGYRLTGDWSFSSGSDHAGWAMVGGVVPGEPPVMMLVPMSDLTIVDDWRTLGLRGTGSKTLRMDGAFVPDRRVVPLSELGSGDRGRGLPVDGGFWERAPLGLFGIYNFATVVVGLGRRAVDITTEMLRTKVSRGVRLGEHPGHQMKLAEAMGVVAIAETVIHGGARAHTEKVRSGAAFSAQEVAGVHLEVALMVRKIRDAVLLLSEISGGWVYDTDPLQQIVRDTLTGSTHRSGNWDAAVLPSAALALESGKKQS